MVPIGVACLARQGRHRRGDNTASPGRVGAVFAASVTAVPLSLTSWASR